MTYSLEQQEMDKIRELVRILDNAQWNGWVLSPEDEKAAIRLAGEIAMWLR